ncbi:hypothetical protein PVA17_21085 [Lysinibacillus sp. CNPSo 3705]|uniref:hypothetical protein n=1 Tax=Lysinibacillus sp. CNPSo 3705 TaxID=3028148 RepID=UPI0023638C87|nr:hypothetical protein [Lysinibacillus sp. CNPSo 3705]MDD1505219.1 hypothetical protein [Lysinibacillus sp. CNPSo 3705]
MSGTGSKSVLLAVGEPNISNTIRKYMSSIGFDVLDDEVLHRKYLNETVELKEPEIVFIHDIYLPSEWTESKDRDQEMLQMIEQWRMLFDQSVRVVYLCVRDRTDPFLGDLVARNVLDIFHEQTIEIVTFKQLLEPPRFSNVKKFGTGNLQIEAMLQEEEQELKELPVNENVTTEAVDELHSREKAPKRKEAEKNENTTTVKDRAQQASQSVKQIVTSIKAKMPKGAEGEADGDDFKEFLDLMPLSISEVSALRPTVIGTVLVAVTSVAPHLGSTYTSLAIASYLAKMGYSVAVIELNYSEDFDRIHALYEGEKQFLKKDDSFAIYGVTHYKYREDLNLNELYPAYEYVLLDFGDLEEAAAFTEEFKRAHVSCVVCSADEWKIDWIHDFLTFNQLEIQECVFVVPNCGADTEKLDDLKGRLDYSGIYKMPTLDNPYEISKEAEITVRDILDDYIKISSSSFSKKALITTSAVSILITTLMFTIIKLFS